MDSLTLIIDFNAHSGDVDYREAVVRSLPYDLRQLADAIEKCAIDANVNQYRATINGTIIVRGGIENVEGD